ncbi:MAG: ADP-ribosylglycohydrolase family protein [Planctomycetota bacterium]
MRIAMLQTLTFLLAAGYASLSAAEVEQSVIDRKVFGLLIGSAIGDAAGGPVEFAEPELVASVLPGFRDHPDVQLDQAGLRQLADAFPLLSYKELRPDPEPYGQWPVAAAAGTITDDTRHKMVLMDALRRGIGDNQLPIDHRAYAQALLRFQDREEIRANPAWQVLCDHAMQEFALAARWELGERDPLRAMPTSRLWGGAATCCGQMTFPPLAGLYPGDPEQAYLATYGLAFIDNGYAKDINAAIVAGLAFAIGQPAPGDDPAKRHAAWRAVLTAMQETDPLRLGTVEFMQRPLAACIATGIEAAQAASRSPAKLYAEIFERCPHDHAWDAHFLLTQAVALAEFCHGEPLSAMHLALDYGEDTDSAAQLLGAIFGAIHGPDLFPAAMRQAVANRLQADHGELLQEWVAVLRKARAIDQQQPVIKPLFDRDPPRPAMASPAVSEPDS